MREGGGSLSFSRLTHRPLFLSLAAGFRILFDLGGYTFGDEKSFSLSGDVKRKTRKVKRARLGQILPCGFVRTNQTNQIQRRMSAPALYLAVMCMRTTSVGRLHVVLL
jgi:hypothetical protein